jgi:pyrrolidone-carboxylate peptidase
MDRIILSGFGPFERSPQNPSGEIARELGKHPPDGLEILYAVLPVTFRAAPIALDELLERAKDPGAPVPALALALGVHRGSGFRLETRARRALAGHAPDNDGVVAGDLALGEAVDLVTPLDLDQVSSCLRRAGAAEVEISTDAGQFVCERIYRHLLEETADGPPALFLHVPPPEALPVEDQVAVVGAFLVHLLDSLR